MIVLLLASMAHAELPVAVTRTDWDVALKRFNAEYAAHPPLPARHDAVQHFIDVASDQFFSESPTAGLWTLANASTLLGPSTRPAMDAALGSLQVQILPVISRQDRSGLLRVRIQPFYPAAGLPPEVTLTLQAADAARPILSVPIRLDFDGGPILLNLPKPDAPPGQYHASLIDPDGRAHRVGDWFVVAKSLDAQRVNTARLLSTTRPTTQAAWDARVLVRARNALLTDNADLNNPTFLTRDPFKLAESVAAEASAVIKGVDPFINRSGDDWRGIPAGGNVIPARLFVPTSALGHPAPLLICLPEATADENEWFDVLADAPLQRFAERAGWIVLATRSVSMLSARQSLAITLRTLGEDYAIDRSRVCLLGHGVGAIAAVDLAVTAPGTVSKLVLLGGGSFGGITQLPPTLQIVGTLDPQFNRERAAESLSYTKAHALPVEQISRESGHALLINDALNDALQWITR